MADVAENRERGASLMFIGLALWVADLLVAFFLPGAIRSGQHVMFVSIITVLAIAGLILMITGYGIRGKNEPS